MSKDHNTITCTHGKGLACPVCYDQTHNLSQCGDACNCMKCNPSKSSCIALSEPEHSMEGSEWVIDPFDAYEPGELPPAPKRVIGTFGALPDGAYFYLRATFPYGSQRVHQKVLEDGPHNAVWAEDTSRGVSIPDDVQCVEITDPFLIDCCRIAASTK